MRPIAVFLSLMLGWAAASTADAARPSWRAASAKSAKRAQIGRARLRRGHLDDLGGAAKLPARATRTVTFQTPPAAVPTVRAPIPRVMSALKRPIPGVRIGAPGDFGARLHAAFGAGRGPSGGATLFTFGARATSPRPSVLAGIVERGDTIAAGLGAGTQSSIARALLRRTASAPTHSLRSAFDALSESRTRGQAPRFSLLRRDRT